MKKYNINSKGEADHLNVSYYVVDDVEAKLAALRSRIAELEKFAEMGLDTARTYHILAHGGIRDFENCTEWRCSVLRESARAILANKVQS